VDVGGGGLSAAIGVGVVEGFVDRLLDLGAGVAVGGGGESCQVKVRGVAAAFGQVDVEDRLALGEAGEVDEEQLVEAAFAQQLGG
jgi:hypothetical protein